MVIYYYLIWVNQSIIVPHSHNTYISIYELIMYTNTDWFYIWNVHWYWLCFWLFYVGANYFGYCADITCSFPANGKFTDDQRFVYNAVLAACLAVHENARPGINWVEMHRLANRVLLTKLKEGGLLRGDVDDMMKHGLNYVFQPHGLGHLIGLLERNLLSHCENQGKAKKQKNY